MVQVAPPDKRYEQRGIRAAERELGLEHTEAVRAVKIAGLSTTATTRRARVDDGLRLPVGFGVPEPGPLGGNVNRLPAPNFTKILVKFLAQIRPLTAPIADGGLDRAVTLQDARQLQGRRYHPQHPSLKLARPGKRNRHHRQWSRPEWDQQNSENWTP